MNSKFLRSLMMSTVTAVITVTLYTAATNKEMTAEGKQALAKIHAIDLEIEELQKGLAQLQAGLSLVVLDNKAYLQGFPEGESLAFLSPQEAIIHDSRMGMYRTISEVYANDIHSQRVSIRELNDDRGMLMVFLESE